MRNDIVVSRHRTTIATAELRFLTEDGSEVTPAEWRGVPVLLVFLRWLG